MSTFVQGGGGVWHTKDSDTKIGGKIPADLCKCGGSIIKSKNIKTQDGASPPSPACPFCALDLVNAKNKAPLGEAKALGEVKTVQALPAQSDLAKASRKKSAD